MAEPLLALGIVVGLVTAFLVYRKKKKILISLLWFALAFLGLGTAAHCLLVPALVAVLANKLLFKWLKKNWAAFLVSLLGVFLVIILLQGTGRIYLTLHVEGPVGLGVGLGRGIAMGIAYSLFIIIGAFSYIITTSITSILRWKNRKK